MRILLYAIVVYVILSAIKGIPAIKVQYCSSFNDNIVYVCTNSTVNSHTSAGVYVDSGKAPKLQRNNCTCSISPTSTTSQTSLNLQLSTNPSDNDINIMFKIKELTLNYSNMGQNVSSNIIGDTSLIYTTQSDTTGGACLSIAPSNGNGAGNFKITCIQKTTRLSDMSNTSNSDSDTDATTSTNIPMDGKKTDMILIGAIVGGIVGLILIVLAVVVLIICCKRKRKPEPTETSDEDAYGMQDNPAYGHFGDVVAPKAIEDHYTEPDFTNKDISSDYDYASHTAAINKVSSQKTQRHEDDTYDHTVTSISGNMTGNDL